MRRALKKIFGLLFRLLIFAVVIIAGIALVKTISFSSRQIPVSPVEKVPVDEQTAQRLARAVSVPTVSGEGYIDTAAFILLDSLVVKSFPLVDSLLDGTSINRFSRVYRWAGRNPDLAPILLAAHLDVVPAEESSLSSWEFPPFGGEIRDGFIWGRGTLDDKSSVFALLETVEQLLREDYLPERTIFLAFGHDEEIGGAHGAREMARYFSRNKIRFEYVLDEASVIVKDALPGLSRPVALIGVAEKGYATLELTAHLEEGGHSSMPPPETAIGMLSTAIDRLRQNPFPARIDGATGALFDYIGPEMNLPYKVLFANRWLTGVALKWQFGKSPGTNAYIRTTTAPTMLDAGFKSNVLPSKASAMINFRIIPGETVESVQRYVGSVIENERIEVTVIGEEGVENPSGVSDVDAFGFQVIQKTVQQLFPEVVVAPALVVGATDSRHYKEVASQTYRFTPVQLTQKDLSRFHGINERISVEGYKDMIRFYRQLILNSCK